MNEDNINGWVSQPDVCRCCLSASGIWDMTASYISETGVKEVFSDIIQECYGITLSHLTQWGHSRLLCALCATHLRDAYAFREQVLRADKLFAQYWSRPDLLKDATMKLEDDANYDADAIFTHDDANTTLNNYKNIDKPKSLRKNCKEIVKSKRKRKIIISDVDYDSDVPISMLVKDGEMGKLKGKRETVVEIADQTEPSKLRLFKIKSQSYIENRQLRSNITLILKYSTVVPFRHVNNSKFACLYCDNSYLLFNKLQEHFHSTHENLTEEFIMKCLKTPKDLIKADISDLKCKLCDENLKTIDNFVVHLKDIHGKVYHDLSMVTPSHGILAFDLSAENLKCAVCTKKFRFFKNLSTHMNEHSANFVCHCCGKKFVSDHRLQTHIIMHNRTNIICRHCDKVFRTVSARNYHIRKVHSNSNFKCSECPKTFAQYYQRLKHLVDSHELIQPKFVCELCGKELATSGGLAAHVRYSHLKNKHYACDVCGKSFVYKWIWQRHKSVHSGAKNFECKFCNKKFAKSYTLQMHLRIHMDDKRFTCNYCKTAFIQKCSLKNHIRTHHSDVKVC